MSYRIDQADVLDWHNEGLYHAMLCDPPYELAFMGRSWDSTGVAFQPETWAHLSQFLHPGAFIMAFGGSRTHHRLACAIEDAGFIVHPSIVWVYGSGFPKATRIDTQVDKAAGVEREVVGLGPYADRGRTAGRDTVSLGAYSASDNPITAPATPLAQAWEGHRYGLQALKPAAEHVIVASKPCNSYEAVLYLLQNTMILEVLTCQSSNARVAVESTRQMHQACRAVVDAFVHGNAEREAWCGLASIVGRSTESSPVAPTLLDFVRGDALTLDGISHFGGLVDSLAKATDTSEMGRADTLENIARLWEGFLAELSNPASMCTTEMATALITDLRILNSALWGDTSQSIIAPQERPGSEWYVMNVDASLRSLAVRWQSQSTTTATETALRLPAIMEGTPSGGIRSSLEMIVVAQKPYAGKPVDCITGTGAGALNIDGGRVAGRPPQVTGQGFPPDKYMSGHGPKAKEWEQPQGRWPANFLMSHSSECIRTGTRRVRGSHGKPDEVGAGNGHQGQFAESIITVQYNDPDGMETIDAWDCASDCPVRRLGEQSGERRSSMGGGTCRNTQLDGIKFHTGQVGHRGDQYFDSGTAARFFFQADWNLEQADPFKYEAKAGKRERDLGLDSFEAVEVQLSQDCEAGGSEWVNGVLEVRLLVDTEPSAPKVIAASTTHPLDATEWSMFLFGSGTTGLFQAATASIIETGISSTTPSRTLSYLTQLLTSASIPVVSSEAVNGGSPAGNVDDCNPSLSFTSGRTVSLPNVGNVPSGTRWRISENVKQRGRSSHPTQKPIALTRYLATLLLPPAEYAPRRILVPFAGAGSECIGAHLAGWDEIVGIEKEPEYVRIAEARLAHWTMQPTLV